MWLDSTVRWAVALLCLTWFYTTLVTTFAPVPEAVIPLVLGIFFALFHLFPTWYRWET